MRYDGSFTDTRSWLFRYQPLLQRSPIEILNYFLDRAILTCLALKPHDAVLEVGCDRGFFLAALRPHCRRAVGVDVNPRAVAQRVCDQVYCMDATRLELGSAQFDKVACLHTIEHIPDLHAALCEMARVLKPSGTAVLVYPCELIRGCTALPSALFAYHDLSMARRLHVHRLDPERLALVAQGTPLRVVSSQLHFTPWPVFPSWISVLRRR